MGYVIKTEKRIELIACSSFIGSLQRIVSVIDTKEWERLRSDGIENIEIIMIETDIDPDGLNVLYRII